MASARLLCFVALLQTVRAIAAQPELYRQPAYESPVSAGPDDLLLIPGNGLTSADEVVYRSTALGAPIVPPAVASTAGPESGVAPVVSVNAPYSLTVKLPREMRDNETYSLWVRNEQGEWSAPLTLNDARPLWLSPSFIYTSRMPAALPRELKVIGRNLQPSPGRTTRIRLRGPGGTLIGTSLPAPDILSHYVARMRLPANLAPGRYQAAVSRDGSAWVAVQGQWLEVLADPPPQSRFSVSDPRFGGCRPDDGIDDTPCITRAIEAAAHAGGGSVYFGPGTWDLIEAGQPGLSPGDGIVVAANVDLEGAGNERTLVQRHPQWNAQGPTAAFTLLAQTKVSGFAFRDLQRYQPGDRAGPFLQLGAGWQRRQSDRRPFPAGAAVGRRVRDIVITKNTFDKPFVAVGSGGPPIARLFIAFNTFGAYNSALELSGDPFDMDDKYGLDDAVIDHNVFKPGSKLDLAQKTGTLASELGGGHRVDFSDNTGDGASADFLYSADDAKGWRAVFFWNLNSDVEEVLISQNVATCTGDKIGDGEAISFDNNTNTFGFKSAAMAVDATAESITVADALAAKQNHRDVPLASYYLGHWLEIVSGPGIGQGRKITGYATDPATGRTTFRVMPAWDVVPVAGRSELVIGRVYWQVYVLDNQIDNRRPLCEKSNRSRRAAGSIVMWAPSIDSVIAGNRQFDSDGIHVQEVYVVPEHACTDCTMQSYFQSFLDIRSNLVDGEYEWSTDCSESGIAIGVGAAPWEKTAPPTVGFGVSVSHNTVRHADAEQGGGIAQLRSWYAGPAPQRWPLSDGLLIHHNTLEDIDGPPAAPRCGKGTARIGIAFPDAEIAWRTVLYANSCKSVARPLGVGGIDSVKVCPSSADDSCECANGSQ
jgi:hypothetical protein